MNHIDDIADFVIVGTGAGGSTGGSTAFCSPSRLEVWICLTRSWMPPNQPIQRMARLGHEPPSRQLTSVPVPSGW